MVCFALPVPVAPSVPVTFHVRETVAAYKGARPGSTSEAVADSTETPAAAPVPDPFDDADALEELEEEIVILSAHLQAGEHRLLELVAEFDRRRGWELGGHRTCAHWLALRTGIDVGAARQKVRAARALAQLPETSAAMSRGELTFSKVRALTRVATPENEKALLELARGATAAVLERMLRSYRLGSREAEAARERRRIESRCLSLFPDEDGMIVVRGRLTPEQGALLMRAEEAANDALYREQGHENGSAEPFGEAEAARRRADALALVAERALAAGFGTTADDPTSSTESSARAPLSGTRAERFQVLLHVDAETLREDGGLGQSELENGTRVSAEVSRRLACDASVVRIGHASDRSVLDVGRKRRTIPPALRRALEVRDRGCRFPGCGMRFTDAHHVRHWADGGETSLDNLILLCGHHHRLVHEQGWKIQAWGRGRAVFLDPRGRAHVDGDWLPPKLEPDPVAALIAENRRRGVKPDFFTTGARWKREADIPDDVYFAATEALG
jgi:hypothetical protein